MPLPHKEPADGVGVIRALEGNSQINFIRVQIDLACIQGKVLDLVHLNRGPKETSIEGDQRSDYLQGLLDRWYDKMPLPFRMEHLASTISPPAATRMTRLYHGYILAVFGTHGLLFDDLDWLQAVAIAAEPGLTDLSPVLRQLSQRTGREYLVPSKEGWRRCVEASRRCMKLFQDVVPTEAVLW